MKAQLKYVSTRKSYAGKVLKYCHNDNYIPEKFALEKRCRTHKLENHQLTNDFFTFFLSERHSTFSVTSTHILPQVATEN